jgi:hypothetical protein
MRPSHYWLLLALLLLGANISVAQSVSENCPVITVTSSSESVWTGTPITFKAHINAMVPTARPEFNWTVSLGVITSGQGTATITVNTDELAFRPVTATVEVKGISTSCPTTAVSTTEVINCGLILKFDEFARLPREDENARLDNFAIQVLSREDWVGYIIAYAGKRTYNQEAETSLARARKYLVEKRKLHPNKIMVIDGGHREEFQMDLYVLPLGMRPPDPTPTVEPAAVEFIKSPSKG